MHKVLKRKIINNLFDSLKLFKWFVEIKMIKRINKI